MNDNKEALTFVYQNAQMGVITIDQILAEVEDPSFKQYLLRKKEGYAHFMLEAKEKITTLGYDEEGLSTFEKLKTDFMVNMQTLKDNSTSHIAEMMMIGSTMGIIQAIRTLRTYPQSDDAIQRLMQDVKTFEETSYEELKQYL